MLADPLVTPGILQLSDSTVDLSNNLSTFQCLKMFVSMAITRLPLNLFHIRRVTGDRR